MPLTAAGNATLKSFQAQYGSKKGTSLFYAKVNAEKAKAKKGSKGSKTWLKKVGELQRMMRPVFTGAGFD